MIFDGEKELHDFYKRDAYTVDFPVRKRNSKKGDDGVVRYITFTCSREGRRANNTSNNVGKWRINTVHLKHNHKTSSSKSRLFRCNSELTANAKRKLELNDMARIPLHKSYNSAVVEAGGYENMNYIEKDCRNYIEQVRRLRLGEGDTASLQSYFSKMQARCSGFYFSMDLDDESRLRNIFWADSRSRQAYKEFGDVVTFNTTYLTNKYDMPFVPFVGVNHHGQSILLGCRFLSNEDTSTFVWLFKTWLKCMHGLPPHGIITDQDRAMQNAIEIVFPNTKHRWCLWHIMKKLPEKFGYHVDKGSMFSSLHNLVYDSQTIDEFEEGMSTTQRSESMNAFFDGYVHSKTSLKQFVEQYERALRSKVKKEFQADFRSYSHMVLCATAFEMENQFQLVYTISKFKEVQDEFIGKVYCDVIAATDGYFGTNYEIRESIVYPEGRRKKTYIVHAITVFDRNDITTIPDKFIVRRWRRDVSRPHTRVAVNYDGLASTPKQIRYDDLCQTFSKLADLAANDEGRARALKDWIKSQAEELRSLNSSNGSNLLSQPTTHLPSQCNNATSNKSKGKRLPPSRTDMEEATSNFQFSGQIQDSQCLLGDVQSQVCGQQLSSTFIPPSFAQLNGTDRFPTAPHIADDLARFRASFLVLDSPRDSSFSTQKKYAQLLLHVLNNRPRFSVFLSTSKHFSHPSGHQGHPHFIGQSLKKCSNYSTNYTSILQQFTENGKLKNNQVAGETYFTYVWKETCLKLGMKKDTYVFQMNFWGYLDVVDLLDGRSWTRLRRTVVKMKEATSLCAAYGREDEGGDFTVFDVWRSPYISNRRAEDEYDRGAGRDEGNDS
ncbi:protein FAR1-RELATED SEQUENCE 5-like [Olea europaea var. sylvestris]|uniref:protein FAR1-RELATED SEQUENCE 5-like n=1 Tax=Olea europaea var. sylvestris TaxID=158386 RepID=UPI000C1CE990|nr:protein FAR1-RELATED SEQUENCE 5-like [Olea europaea var. sylvestris]